MRGDGRIYQRTPSTWGCQYSVAGRVFRKSGFPSKQDARGYLRTQIAKARLGQVTASVDERLTVDQMLDAYRLYMLTKGSRSVRSFVACAARVRASFGYLRAGAVTETTLDGFIRDLRERGLANGTINRSLQALRASYRLALRRHQVQQIPVFTLLTEATPRQGFLEADEFARLLSNCPDWLVDVCRFAYRSAWRRGEILGLKWSDIDRKAREIRLSGSRTKNGKPRSLPLAGELLDVIERRWMAREFESHGVTRLAEFVFHRNGQPLRDFRKAWRSACVATGLGHVDEKDRYSGRLFHDFRRSAVRNLVRAGVPQSVAMKVSGHETDSVFRRYDIVSQEDKVEALARVEAFSVRSGTGMTPEQKSS